MSTYDTESARIKRQQAIADALRASGNEALPASIHTGGRFDAPVSGWEYANKALQQVLSAYMSKKADNSQTKLSQAGAAELANVVAAKKLADVQENQAPAAPGDDLAEVPTLPKVNGKAAMQAAALRGVQFGGDAGDVGGEIMKRDMFPPVKQDYTLGADDVRFDKSNRPVATGLPRTVNQPADDRALLPFDAKTVPDATPEELKAGRALRARSAFKPGMVPYEKPTGAGSGGPNALGLDEETLDNGARDIIRNGPAAMFQYVSRAAQDKPTRDALNNRATKIARAAGMSNDDVARFRSRVAGEVHSQKELVDMKNAVESYEVLAKANGQRVLQLIDKVDTTGVPALEGMARAVKSKVLGDADVAEFQSVMKTYQTEVARIISQPRLRGQLTDTQIQEMSKVVDGTATAPMLKRIINRLDLEMDIRKNGIDKQLNTSGGAMSIPAQAPAPRDPVVADPNAMPDPDAALLQKWGQ